MSQVDRYGEPIEEPSKDEQSPAPPVVEPCGCDDGWLDYVDAEHPTPCPKCKPHLVGPRVHLH